MLAFRRLALQVEIIFNDSWRDIAMIIGFIVVRQEKAPEVMNLTLYFLLKLGTVKLGFFYRMHYFWALFIL
jgi:hypothetical protein